MTGNGDRSILAVSRESQNKKAMPKYFYIPVLRKQQAQCELELFVVNEPSLFLKTQTSVEKLHNRQQCPGTAA